MEKTDKTPKQNIFNTKVSVNNNNLKQQKTDANKTPKKSNKTANSAQANLQKNRRYKDLSKASKEIKEDLIKNLEFMNRGNNYELLNNSFFLPLERELSEHRDLYSHIDSLKRIASKGLNDTAGRTSDNELCAQIIKRYVYNAFGIFDFVLDLQASDIFIVQNKISFTNTNNEKATEIIIPDALIPRWNALVDRFIILTLYASDLPKTKFDRINAILDYECETVRFNVAHSALSANRDGRPIISLRNQLLDFNKASTAASKRYGEQYIKSQKLSKKQLATINDLALNSSYLVLGETGSGKTSLLKYMGGYRIEDKRNLITIEDTPELFLPVNISYLTNERFTISDLFKVSLRENPSEILIGETRSSEIVNILESGLVFNCGTTLHANSFEKAVMRIIFLAKNSETHYSTEDIQMLISTVMGGFIWMKDRQIKKIWKRKEDITDWTDVLNNYELVE